MVFRAWNTTSFRFLEEIIRPGQANSMLSLSSHVHCRNQFDRLVLFQYLKGKFLRNLRVQHNVIPLWKTDLHVARRRLPRIPYLQTILAITKLDEVGAKVGFSCI